MNPDEYEDVFGVYIKKKTPTPPPPQITLPQPPVIPNIQFGPTPFQGILAGMSKKEYDLSKSNGLKYPFECWGDDGGVYRHEFNWHLFVERIEKGGHYPHNWLHRRLHLTLHSPRNSIHELPLPPGMDRVKLDFVDDDWSVVYEPYPAHFRTELDKKANLDSWALWVEDRHPKPTYGDPICLMSTGKTIADELQIAYFRNQYWRVIYFKDYGLGHAEPSDEEKKRLADVRKKKSRYRSIDDE